MSQITPGAIYPRALLAHLPSNFCFSMKRVKDQWNSNITHAATGDPGYLFCWRRKEPSRKQKLLFAAPQTRVAGSTRGLLFRCHGWKAWLLCIPFITIMVIINLQLVVICLHLSLVSFSSQGETVLKILWRFSPSDAYGYTLLYSSKRTIAHILPGNREHPSPLDTYEESDHRWPVVTGRPSDPFDGRIAGSWISPPLISTRNQPKHTFLLEKETFEAYELRHLVQRVS